MPGRTPRYQSASERPVTLCVRVPRDLYEQVHREMDTRRLTLTEASLDALRLWVETPADPRDAGPSCNSNTHALQQLEARVGARIAVLEVALATLRGEAAPSPSARPPSPDHSQYDSSNTSVIQEAASDTPVPVPTPTAQGTRKGGRPRSAMGQRLLELLAAHPDGLSAEQIRGFLTPDKPLGDLLAGMRRLGTVRTEGQGRTLRYFLP